MNETENECEADTEALWLIQESNRMNKLWDCLKWGKKPIKCIWEQTSIHATSHFMMWSWLCV